MEIPSSDLRSVRSLQLVKTSFGSNHDNMTNIKVKEIVAIAEINRRKSQCLDTKIAPCLRKLWHKIINGTIFFLIEVPFLNNITYID